MATRLLHHDPGKPAGVSPFDEAILEVAEDGPLQIVCPYIDLRYLKRILVDVPKWSLIADVEAWLSSRTATERGDASAFILGNQKRVRHIKGVHAKAVIGAKACYFGSANLTKAGILGKTELGLYSAEPAMLVQLHNWFEDLWEAASEVTVDQLRLFSEVADDHADAVAELELDALPELHIGQPKVRAKLALRKEKAISIEPPPETAIVDWLDQFLIKVETAPFKLSEVLQYARGLHRSIRKQDVEHSLLLRCGNHPDTLFDIKVRRQLLWKEGAFQVASPPEVRVALASYDQVLVELTLALDFDSTHRLPKSARGSHLSARAFELFIDALVASEFLLAAKDGLYTLNEGWEWGSEFLAFTATVKLWQSKFDGRRVKHGPSVASLPGMQFDSPEAIKIDAKLDLPIFGKTVSEVPDKNSAALSRQKQKRVVFERLDPEEKNVLEHRVDLIYKAVSQLVASNQLNQKSIGELANFLVDKLGETDRFVERVLDNEDIVGEPLYIFDSNDSEVQLRLNPVADYYQFEKTFNFICGEKADINRIKHLNFPDFIICANRMPPHDKKTFEREYRDARHTGDKVFAALIDIFRRGGGKFLINSKLAVWSAVQKRLRLSNQDMHQFKMAMYSEIIPEVARLEFNDSADKLNLALRYATRAHLQAFPLTKAALGEGPPYKGFVWFEGVV